MNELLALLSGILDKQELIFLVISNKRHKQNDLPEKITVTPYLGKGGVVYQVCDCYEKKANHQNVDAGQVLALCEKTAEYKNMTVYAVGGDYQVLRGKKGNLKVIKKPATKKLELSYHDQKKQYILQDGTRYPFLVRLGIMSDDGKVKAQKFNKFVQINKYLEIVASCMKSLEDQDEICIVDFGCGKAYLTFALYYYLCEVQQKNVRIVGVDLKADVISLCQKLAADLGFSGMEFVCGDIFDFNTQKKVDMVVSLHACDTATDAALEKAVKWQSRVILAVPCCQHELFGRMQNEIFAPMQKHGILNDQLAALLTDTLRSLALEVRGYQVTVMEFLPLEHTAKNVLIKAVYHGRQNDRAKKQFETLKAFFHVNPAIDVLVE